MKTAAFVLLLLVAGCTDPADPDPVPPDPDPPGQENPPPHHGRFVLIAYGTEDLPAITDYGYCCFRHEIVTDTLEVRDGFFRRVGLLQRVYDSGTILPLPYDVEVPYTLEGARLYHADITIGECRRRQYLALDNAGIMRNIDEQSGTCDGIYATSPYVWQRIP